MKKIVITLLILLIPIYSNVAFADDPENKNPLNDKKQNIQNCISTFTKEFPAFIQTIISAEGFTENFTAYFTDIVSRSACQLQAIMALDSKLDSITKQIQNKYLDCKLKEIPPLKKKYIQAKAEIYYIRHIINPDGDLESIIGDTDVTVEDIEDNPLINEEMFVDLYPEMYEKYAPILPEDVYFDDIFEEIEIKFKTSKYEFLLCGEGQVWKMVSDKWKEFKENWGGSKDAIKNLDKRIKQEAENISSSIDEMKLRYEKNASNKPAGAFKNFVSNTFKTSINSLDPVAGLNEIYDEMTEYLPANQAPDMKSLFNATSNESERYKFDLDRKTIEARYTALYAGVTDAAVFGFNENLNTLMDTLKASNITISRLNKCADKILNKQCKK